MRVMFGLVVAERRYWVISSILIPELQKRFAGRQLRIGSAPTACAVFPAIHPDVGDVEIFDEGDELTVVAGKFTHGHFSSYDQELSPEQKAARIVQDTMIFLEELFADRIILWGSHDGSGGWYKRDRSSDWASPGTKYVWSGPLPKPPEL
jgi:hypothetical protein